MPSAVVVIVFSFAKFPANLRVSEIREVVRLAYLTVYRVGRPRVSNAVAHVSQILPISFSFVPLVCKRADKFAMAICSCAA